MPASATRPSPGAAEGTATASLVPIFAVSCSLAVISSFALMLGSCLGLLGPRRGCPQRPAAAELSVADSPEFPIAMGTAFLSNQAEEGHERSGNPPMCRLLGCWGHGGQPASAILPNRRVSFPNSIGESAYRRKSGSGVGTMLITVAGFEKTARDCIRGCLCPIAEACFSKDA